MALPATGQQISMNQVRIHYGRSSGQQRLSTLGSVYLGIGAGNQIRLSAAFGGQP